MARIIHPARNCTGDLVIERFLSPCFPLRRLCAYSLPWFAMLLLPASLAADEIQNEGIEPGTQAVEVDTSRWLCSLCLYPIGWFGTLDIGAGNVSDSSLKFGDYRGLEKRGLFLVIDGDTHYRDRAGHYLDLYARNLGIDSRQIEMRGGEQGRFELRLAYSELPKYRGFDAQTPFLGVGNGRLTLPGDWVKATQTSDMTTLGQFLADTPLKTDRKTLDAGLTLKFAGKWSLRADFEHQEKEGTRAFGAGLFRSNAVDLPAPVDFTTRQFDLGLEYAGERSRLSFGFMGSSFENGASTFTWENPFLSGPETDVSRASLAPDNDFYQFSFNGYFAPTPKLRLSGRLAIGNMKQDDPFLPFSINPLFSDLPLPRTSLDGKIDTGTLNLAGKLSARLSRRLDLTARVKLDERDNKTAIDLFTPVLTDLELDSARPNRPYSFEREKYEVELRWRANNSIRLMGGIKRENVERSLQNVAETAETIYWGEASFSPWAVAQFRLKIESSERNASPFLRLDDGGPLDNPLLRKFHLADRDRDRAIFELDLSPLEGLGISLSYFRAEDDYSASLVGLQESEERSLSLDLNYSIGRNMGVYAFATQDDIDSHMSSISGDTGLVWNAVTDDSISTVGFGFDGRISEKIILGFDWVNSDAAGKIRTDSGQGEAPFPGLKSELRNARIHVSYTVNARWGIKLYAEHEKLDSEDWFIDGLGPASLPAVLTLGLVSPDYRVTVLRILASYTF